MQGSSDLPITVYIHPGYPKTGTTTLQGSIFPDVCHQNGWHYFGKRYGPNGESRTDPIVREFIREFPAWNELFVAQNAADVRARFGLDNHRTLFVSLEELILRSLKGEIVGGRPVVDDFGAALRKLRALFTGTKAAIRILITIRNQRDLLPSLYAQGYNHYFRRIAETRTFGDFLEYVLDPMAGGHTISPLYYDGAVRYAMDLFGIDNTLVLPFELMQTRPAEFLAYLSRLLSIDIDATEVPQLNPRKTTAGWKSREVTLLGEINARRGGRAARGVPAWLRRPAKRILRSIPMRRTQFITAMDEQLDLIGTAFASSNARLNELIEPDLTEWGY